MTAQFSQADTPPQVFLDQLHEIGVPRLFDPGLNETQRTNLITLSRNRLSEWQTRIVDQTKNIELRYKHLPDQARLHVAPYKRLISLNAELNKAISDLERTIKQRRALPRSIEFGTRIYGTFETGEWHLGDFRDAKRWDQMEAIRKRLTQVRSDFEPMKRDMELAGRRAKEARHDLKKMQRRHSILRKKFPFVLFTVIVVSAMIWSLWLGISIVNGNHDLNDQRIAPVIGASLLIVAISSSVMLFTLVRRRRLNLAHIEMSIAMTIADYRSHKQESHDIRMQLHPMMQLARQLTTEYKELRKTFPE
jgi:hypothetical protein